MKGDAKRADLLAYLRTLSASPADLPADAAASTEQPKAEEAAAEQSTQTETSTRRTGGNGTFIRTAERVNRLSKGLFRSRDDYEDFTPAARCRCFILRVEPIEFTFMT